jgi:hypothetical protein
MNNYGVIVNEIGMEGVTPGKGLCVCVCERERESECV